MTGSVLTDILRKYHLRWLGDVAWYIIDDNIQGTTAGRWKDYIPNMVPNVGGEIRHQLAWSMLELEGCDMKQHSRVRSTSSNQRAPMCAHVDVPLDDRGNSRDALFFLMIRNCGVIRSLQFCLCMLNIAS